MATVSSDVSEMIVMDTTGDTRTTWNRNSPEEVAIARASFDGLRAKGYIAYRDNQGGKGAVMTEFDPTAEKVILSPPMAGG